MCILYLHISAKITKIVTYLQDKDLPGPLSSSKEPSHNNAWPVNPKLIACRLSYWLLFHQVIRQSKCFSLLVLPAFSSLWRSPLVHPSPSAPLLQAPSEHRADLTSPIASSFCSASPENLYCITCHSIAVMK